MHRSPDLQRLLLWGLSGPVIALNIWLLTQLFRYFEHLITLLAIAAILAFLLDYPVRLFRKSGFSRTQSVTVVWLLTIAILVILGLTLVPVITDQANQLMNRFPGWLSASQENIAAIERWARLRRLPLDLQGFSRRLNAQLENQIQTIAPQALEVALGTLSGLVDSILVFVLAFYMLLDGNRLWQGLINLLPPHFGIPLARSLRLNFQNFFISQILLALVMVLALIPVLLILKVPFALLFALLIGVAELIPFFGATLGIGLVTILVMLQDLGLGLQVAITSTILQQLRDNVLAPRMMGNLTGLNPLWIFIALLMGLQIAGFLGAIVSVPIAGTIKGTLDAIRANSLSLAALPPSVMDESG